VRVLDRPRVARKPSEDSCAIGQEPQSEQSGIVEEAFDDRDKGSELEAVASRNGRWRQSILGARAMVTCTECDCSEPCRIVEQHPCRKPNFD
jgi:hypothetical protein